MEVHQHLELDVRKKIYDCIVKQPGIHFREIQRIVKIATGSLDYHLHFLHKHGVLRTEKYGKYVRYYALTKNFTQEEKDILSFLRQEKIRHILIYLIEKNGANPKDIVKGLKMSNATLSWYLKRLAESGMIAFSKKGRFRKYNVVDKEKIIKYIILHKRSFFDEIVDRFIDAWEFE